MATPKRHFCHEIVVDRAKGEIRMDGVVFPYWTTPDPEIEIPRHDQVPIGVLNIGIFAESITYIGDDGRPKPLLEATPAAHSEWARRRAKEIVLERMADVLSWLEQAADDRQDAEYTAYHKGYRAGVEASAAPPPPPQQWPTMPPMPRVSTDVPVRACDNAEMAHKPHLFTLAGEGQFSCPGRL